MRRVSGEHEIKVTPYKLNNFTYPFLFKRQWVILFLYLSSSVLAISFSDALSGNWEHDGVLTKITLRIKMSVIN